MDTKREIIVSVMLGDTTYRIGRLYFNIKNTKESSSFKYDDEWLVNPNSFMLEPALQLVSGSQQPQNGQTLFGAIGDSAPDRWGRVLMKRAKGVGTTLTELDYLLGVNDETRQGALRFSEIDGEYLANTGKPIPPLIKLPELLSAAEKFMEDSETAEELKLLLAPGSSLGGARPKASIIDKDGSLAIAKFPKKDDEHDVVVWEAVALTLAKNAGINVPKWRLETILGKSVLIIKRFDRDGNKRIPFLSAMSMLGATDNDNQNHSYADIAYVLQQYGKTPAKDIAELWRRMVFNIMIANTDDHLRNHGFLYGQNTGWTLSPAYDMNPTTNGRQLSTFIDGTGGATTLDKALQVAPQFGLSGEQAQQILGEVKTAVSDWCALAKRFGIPEHKIDRMKMAFMTE